MTARPSELTYLRTLVRDRSAIVIEPNKDYLIESRLAPIARDAGFESIGGLIAGLRAPRTARTLALEKVVIEAMTTNETLFFRDAHPFAALESFVIPELKRLRSRKPLSIWSAACSTGQEPYSIAMLLADRFPELDGTGLRILATDLADGILEYARRGRYRQLEVNRGLPAPMLVKYFDRDGSDYVIKDKVRLKITFQAMNLIERWPAMPMMDLVFMRNVLIYFDVDTKRAILNRVKQVLAPDGFLFLGTAETTINIDESFVRMQEGRAVFYRMKARGER
jgi:chemotaxis protein methyltransferase CheR